MAEKKGFFRRIFSFANAPEDDRVPEHAMAPRSDDTLVGVTPGAPDPDLHHPALADAQADAEAGASPDDGGGITPLKDMQAASGKTPPASDTSAAAPDEAQKKTP
ncbi:hypothetical protein [Mangrovicella endophytica]|uniref:hypothetical protein n=1 Tax=Mangrovicella endophytica TaxID=2066697 RepID=UPI000C9DE705|nr:hypothetical protein [Mangrovicella endophytica]